MFNTDRLIQFRIEDRPGYKNMQIRMPCTEDWSQIHEIPDYSYIRDKVFFISEFETDENLVYHPEPEAIGEITYLNINDWPPEMLKALDQAQTLGAIIYMHVIGHTLPKTILGIGDKCLAEIRAATNAKERIDVMPFTHVPVEINGEKTSLRDLSKALALPLPEPGQQLSFLEGIFDMSACGTPEYQSLIRAAASDFIANYDSNYNLAKIQEGLN